MATIHDTQHITGDGNGDTTQEWGRLAALGGIGFVACLIISFFAPAGTPPNVDDSTTSITNYYVTHHTGILISDFFGAASTFFFVYFLGSLWRTLRHGDGSGIIAVAAVAAGVAGGAMAGLGGTVDAALAFKAAKLGDPGLVRALFDISQTTLVFIWFPVAALVMATSLVGRRSGTFPSWHVWGGIVVVVVALLATLGIFADKANLLRLLGLIAFILFVVWVVATSILMYTQMQGASNALRR